jgi:phenylalanyl-tRNA synthetase beta chain
MLELGRPLHVYDLDKLEGGIEVRFGKAGEHLELLNDVTVEVDDAVLCITDGSGPIGLAGVMGGDSTKAELDTRHIFLESAFFYPEAVAGRARRYNISSDAAHRFERGVDFSNCVDGVERATSLIMEICGGEPGPTVDVVAGLPKRSPVRMRVTRAHKVIGVPVPAGDMADIFSRLGLAHARETGRAGDTFVVTPPSFRFDIEIEEDLIEEVARVYGFERIPARPPHAPLSMRVQRETHRSTHAVRLQLASSDYFEVINFSFERELQPQPQARAHPRFRNRTSLSARSCRQGRSPRCCWCAPADPCRRYRLWSRIRRAMGHSDTQRGLLRRQGGCRGPAGATRC